jgi:small-conductance mechanosensitive channel
VIRFLLNLIEQPVLKMRLASNALVLMIAFETCKCSAFNLVSSHLFLPKINPSSSSKTLLHDSLNIQKDVDPSGSKFVSECTESAVSPVSGGKRKFSLSFVNPKFVEIFFNRALKKFIKDQDNLELAAKICSYITGAYFILSILGTFGFDTAPLLSLLSVSGLTIGFAAKDILTSTFKGFFILITKPFSRGSIISVGGFKGKVLSIDIRYVKLQSAIDKSEILVPLSMVYGSTIVVENIPI